MRPQDRGLVDALQRFLSRRGLACATVGRNFSSADPPDVAIKKLLSTSDCLVGLATARLSATDGDFPDRSLVLATPYLLQETSMAFQAELPFLIFRAPGIALQGVTKANLYIDINPDASNGVVRFRASQRLVETAIEDLKKRAIARRQMRSSEAAKSQAKTLVTWGVGAYAALKTVGWLARPDCFSQFHYKDTSCKECSYRADCKAEKARRQG